MNSKLFFLMTILALILGTTFGVVACGDDDDDDDDVADDDVDDDATDCEVGLGVVYDDCDLALADEDGNQLTKDEAIGYCEDGDATATCASGCGLTGEDCDAVLTCFNDSCA